MQTLSAEEFKKKYGDAALSGFVSPTDKEPGLLQRVGTDIVNAGNQVSDTYQQGVQGHMSLPRAATGVVASAFNTIPKVASEVLPQPVRQGIEAAGSGIGKGLNWLAQKTTPQFMVDFVSKHPDAAKMLEEGLGTLSNAGQISGDILAADQGAKLAQKGVDLTVKAGQKIGQGIKNTAQMVTEKAKGMSSNLRGNYNDPKTFARDLVTPELKGKELLKAVKSGKVQEGQGLLGQRNVDGAVYNLDDLENAVKDVPGISHSKTNLQNLNAIHDEIGNLANELESQAGAEKTFFSPSQFKGVMNQAKLRLAEDPSLVGDAANSAGKVMGKFESLVAQEGYTSAGLLRARKLLDQWILKYKPKAFSPATESGITGAIREIRQSGNKFLAEVSPNSDVIPLLEKQTNLYRAIDNIAPKAVVEGSSALQQIIKAHPVVAKTVRAGARLTGIGAAVKMGEDFIPTSTIP